MMRTIIAIFVLAFAGCTVSTVPITGDEAQTDDRLLGTWQAKVDSAESGLETIVVTRRADGALIAEPPAKQGVDQESERLRLVTARVGNHWYLSVTGANEPPESGGYMLLRYEFRGPKRLVLFAANPELLLDAVAKKQVSGEKVPDRHVESIKLTSDATALRAFIAQHGAEIFKEELPVIERVR